MHFKKNDFWRTKGMRACSLLLSVLIMCSMLFVGSVGSIEAEAMSISSGQYIYVDCNDNNSWWDNDYGSANWLGVWYWGAGNSGTFAYLEQETSGTRMYKFQVSVGTDCTGFKLFRMSTASHSGSYPSKYVENPRTEGYYNVANGNNDIVITSGNCVKVNNDSALDTSNCFYTYTPASSGGGGGDTPITDSNTIYIDLSLAASWWTENHSGTSPAIYYECSDGSVATRLLTKVNDSSNSNMYSYTFDEKGFTKFKIGINFRDTPVYEFVGADWQTTQEITSIPSGKNCLQVQVTPTGGVARDVTWSAYTPTTQTTNNNLTAAGNYGTKNSATGYYTVDGQDLYPVDATFYDYYTDYEVAYGWRANQNSYYPDEGTNYYASRSYENSFPFQRFNEYISNYANTNNWNVPLYFGNFFLGNTAPGTYWSKGLRDHSQLTFENGSSNNRSVSLYNFSIQANNSCYLGGNTSTSKNASNTNYSTVGLVDSSLSGTASNNSAQSIANLKLTSNNNTVPYFDDTIVDQGYATKISTEFPFRVETKSATNGTAYDTYSFTSTSGTDNVYFSGYDSSLQLNYSTSKKVYDAHGGFGGSNGYGFFPFDEGSASGTNAQDFGFGMRVDIEYYYGENGYVSGTNKNVPMVFNFSGDDDMWVFIDGKLALDLGGDHGSASGSINFATRQATYTTGKLDLTNQTGITSNIFKGSETTVSLSSVITDADLKLENATTPHTLTVFYMERGMSESNLSIDFVLSATPNILEMSKNVKTTDVNPALSSDVDALTKLDSYDFSFVEKDTSGTEIYSDYVYTVINSSGNSTTGILSNTNQGNGKVNLKADDIIRFENQFSDNANVLVVETDPGNKYKYTNKATVRDKKTGAIVQGINDTDVPSTGLQFSTNAGDTNIFEVDFDNVVKTSGDKSLTLAKVLLDNNGNTISTQKDFEFEVKIKLPGETAAAARAFTYYYTDSSGNRITKDGTADTASTTYTAGSDGKVTLKNGWNIVIPGLPIGTETEITETTGGYVTTKSTATENEQTTVTFTNQEYGTCSPEIKVTKKINGRVSSSTPTDFSFTAAEYSDANTPVKDASGNAVTYNANSAADGTISFTGITYDGPGTHWYKITENDLSTTLAETYTKDSSEIWAKVDVTAAQSTSGSNKVVTLTAATTYYNAYNGTALTDVSFNNTTNAVPANLAVVKRDSTDSDTVLSGAEFTLEKGSVDSSSGAWTTDDGSTYNSSSITLTGGKSAAAFTNLAEGSYRLLETKAPAGYELDGSYHYFIVESDGTVYTAKIESNAVVKSPSTALATDNTYAVYYFADTKSTELPKTGGAGVAVFVIIGVALVVAAILILKPSKKEKASGQAPGGDPPDKGGDGNA